MMSRSFKLLAMLALPVAAPTVAHSATFADLAVIDRDIELFTGVPSGQQGGASLPVDRRLRLVACQSPLALSWRLPQRDSVVVQCPDNGGWRLFVPVTKGLPEVQTAPVVSRGDAVTISVAGEGFTISRPGEALEAGAVGALIRVRNAQGAKASADPIRARVVRPGLVSVPLE